jgi:hypothetical protein
MQKNVCLLAFALFLFSLGRSQSKEVSIVPFTKGVGKFDDYIGHNGQYAFWDYGGGSSTKAQIRQVHVEIGQEERVFAIKLPKKPKGIRSMTFAGLYPFLIKEQSLFAFITASDAKYSFYEVFVQAYDLEGNLDGPLVSLFKITGDFIGLSVNWKYIFSPDGSKVAVRFSPKSSLYTKYTAHGYGVILDLVKRKAVSTRLWIASEEDYFPWPQEFLVDNDGGRYFLRFSRDKEHYAKTQESIWAFNLLYISPGAPISQAQTFTVDFGNKHIISSRIQWEGEHILFSGCFEDRPGQGAQGIYLHKVHKDSISFHGVQTLRFPDSLQTMFGPDSNPHLNKTVFDSSNHQDRVVVKHISRMPNQGYFFVIAQRVISYEVTRKDHLGTYPEARTQLGDLILMRISPEGKFVSLDIQDVGGDGYSINRIYVSHKPNGVTGILAQRKAMDSYLSSVWLGRYAPGKAPEFLSPVSFPVRGKSFVVEDNPLIINDEMYFPYSGYNQGWAKYVY